MEYYNKNGLNFEDYNFGVKCTTKSLSTNRIKVLDRCSKLMEVLRYLNNLNLDNKRLVLLQQVLSMNSLTSIGETK